MRKATRLKLKPKCKHTPTPDLLREALYTALEQCWEGRLPFRELEKAIALKLASETRLKAA